MTVARQLTIMTVVMISLFILVGASSFYSVTSLIEVNESLSHTQSVLEELHSLEYEITQCDSAESDYILTGQEEFLEPYHASVQQTLAVLASLKELVKRNPEQSSRINRLIPLVQSRISTFDKAIATCKANGQQAATEIVRSHSGKNASSLMRAQIDEITATEKTLHQERVAEVARSKEGSLLTILAGVALELVLVLLYNMGTATTLTRCIRLLIKAMDNFDRGRFDTAPMINSRDEFGMLSRSLHQLGRTMQRQQDDLLTERAKRIENSQIMQEAALSMQKLASSFSALRAATIRVVLKNGRSRSQSDGLVSTLEEDPIKRTKETLEHLQKQSAIIEQLEKRIQTASERSEALEHESEKCRDRAVSIADLLVDLMSHGATLTRLSDQLLTVQSNHIDFDTLNREGQAQQQRQLLEECRDNAAKMERLLIKATQSATSLESLSEEARRDAKSSTAQLAAATSQLAELRTLQGSVSLLNRNIADALLNTLEDCQAHRKDLKELDARVEEVRLLFEPLAGKFQLSKGPDQDQPVCATDRQQRQEPQSTVQ